MADPTTFTNPFHPPSPLTDRAGQRVLGQLGRWRKWALWSVIGLPPVHFGLATLFFGYGVPEYCYEGRFRYDDACIARIAVVFLAISFVALTVFACAVADLYSRWGAFRRSRRDGRQLDPLALPVKTAFLRGRIDEHGYVAIRSRLADNRRGTGIDHGWSRAGQFLLHVALWMALMATSATITAIVSLTEIRQDPDFAMPMFVSMLIVGIAATVLCLLALVYGWGLRRAGRRSRKAFVKQLKALGRLLEGGGTILAKSGAMDAPSAVPEPPRYDVPDPWRGP